MRTTTAAFLFSLSIHAVIGYTLWMRGLEKSDFSLEPIQISEIHFEKPLIPAKAPEPPKPKMEPVQFKKQTFSSANEAMKSAAIPVKKTPPSLKNRAASPVASTHPKTAMDFLADPEKGKIYLEYFGKLKEKIQANLRRKYHSADDSLGVVTLFFVLNPDGSLVKTGVVHGESDANEGLQKVALDALKRSAPFGTFPKDLGNGAVAFNLKVYFDELE